MISLTEGKYEQRKTYFVDVILPLGISGAYTYRVPQEFTHRIKLGLRVIVPFGKNKIYSGLIYAISEKAPERYEAKYLIDVLDEEPILHETQFRLWEWMSNYYLSTLGEVMQAALPAALKLASETKVTLGVAGSEDRSALNDKEFLILEALDLVPELKVSEIVKLLGQKSVFPLLKGMFEKGLIEISEEISPKFKPKVRVLLRLAPEFKDAEGLKFLLDSLNRAPKQQDVILAYLQLAKLQDVVTKKDLVERVGCSPSVVQSLVEKGVLLQEEQVVSRIGGEDVAITANFELTPAQQRAETEIQTCFQQQDVVLLHGVTSSGKTQLYVRLIEEVLRKGKQALYLLPEIALTTHITERLRIHFGNQLAVYHSRFNDNERAEIWQKVASGEVKLVVGARSSIFLPFSDLGLIVVDEEHEVSFKQFDPAPRYHARDTAIFLGHLHSAKVLLGSATPSVESYYNAKSGKYGLVQLTERFGVSVLPEITVIDIKEASRKNNMHSYFSEALLEAIKESVEAKKQVILFQNRRGHTPISQCKTCSHTAKCMHCDVSLTYHKTTGQLQCHYCGFAEDPMVVCPACGSLHIESKGFGTERIEEELLLLLPDLRIGRLDFDTTRGKHGFERVLADFDDHQYDVLIGTQMVAKGLDFGNVNVIGIVSADSLIHFPDFRAYERAFSLFAQVAGRSGRREDQGKVFIQTYSPQHRVIQQVVAHDFEGLFNAEIVERKNFKYPPFTRMIRIDLKHLDFNICRQAAERLAFLLRASLEERVLGPEQPLVSRVRNFYIQRITLKVERKGISMDKVKQLLRQTIQQFAIEKSYKSVRVQIDVDPY